MESANRWSQIAGSKRNEVRIAEQADAGAITRLLRHAPFSHIHADWHFPAEWLGMPSFVVIPESSENAASNRLPSRLFSAHLPLLGCLAVAADPPPAAWVRVAAISNKNHGRELISAMLSAVHDPLRQLNITEVAWLLVDDWPESWLPDLGFELINEVITYSKSGTTVPRFEQPADLQIRPVESIDFVALAEIEARAFEPLWQHSELSLSLARQQALSFDVALLAGELVGFQLSSSTRYGAHLSRITVDPAVQKRGVGSALLAHALEGYEQRGISTVTLNTQLDNTPSQALYERFGFHTNLERFPVWRLSLE